MKKPALFATLSLTLAMLASACVHAATTAELKVIGVIKPPACTMNFTAGNEANYGTIAPSSLSTETFTMLQTKSLPFSISCDVPSKMALAITDNRSNSVVSGITSDEDKYSFGLALSAQRR